MLWTRAQTVATLVSKSGFLKRGPRPPLGPRKLFSVGHEQRQRPKLGIFIDEQGATSVESLLKGATAHES